MVQCYCFAVELAIVWYKYSLWSQSHMGDMHGCVFDTVRELRYAKLFVLYT